MQSIQSISFADFLAIVEACPNGVVLLEGRRNIPNEFAIRAESMGRQLASKFPTLRFRSGNATGTDEAFSAGIASLDAARLHIVAPYASHRKKYRYAEATYDSPDTLTQVEEDAVAYKTNAASPKAKGLVANRGKKGPLGAKAAYLIRDTLKVTGHSGNFPKPICALFFVDLDDPLAGGTGHTLRVCQQENVPFAFQDAWTNWLT
jgi:hypothetical protein